MGYDVHITRKINWSEEAGPDISLDEWVTYVKGDPEMRLDGFAEVANKKGEMLRLESPGLSVWLPYSGHGIEGGMAWFSYHQGNIVVKNPDEEILRKMWQIAQAFSAQVQGDEGETYNQNGETSPNSELLSTTELGAKKPWWKVW